jgi:hypothetical protein
VIHARTTLQALMATAAVAAVFACAPAHAASKATNEAQAIYARERAACFNGLSNQDRATCLKEASAALQEARRGQLGAAASGNLEANRLARCEAQSGADRDECITRMRAGTTTGSAPSGGILRESTSPDTTKK